MGDLYIAASSQIDKFRSEVVNAHRTLEIKFMDTRVALGELPEDGANASEQSKLFTDILSKTIRTLKEITKFLKEKKKEFRKVQCVAMNYMIREHRGRESHEKSESGYGSIVSSSLIGSGQSQTLQPISIIDCVRSEPDIKSLQRVCQHYSVNSPVPVQHESLDGVTPRPGLQHDESKHIEELVPKCNIEDSESDDDNIETDEIGKQNTLASYSPTIHRRHVDVGVQTTFPSSTLETRASGFCTVSDITCVSHPPTCKDFANIPHTCESCHEADVNITAHGSVAEIASEFEKFVVRNENLTHQNLKIKQNGNIKK